MNSIMNEDFFSQVNDEIQFNYPPFKYSNKLKNKCASFLLEEEGEDADGSGDGVAEGGSACSLEEVDGEEDCEDSVAVVDGMRVDAVDAKRDQWSGQEEGQPPIAIRSNYGDSGFASRTIFSEAIFVEECQDDAPGEDGGDSRFDRSEGDVGVVDAAAEADDRCM